MTLEELLKAAKAGDLHALEKELLEGAVNFSLRLAEDRSVPEPQFLIGLYLLILGLERTATAGLPMLKLLVAKAAAKEILAALEASPK